MSERTHRWGCGMTRPDIHTARGAGEPIRPEVADWVRGQGGVLRSLLDGGVNETDLLIIAEHLERPDDRIRRIVREEIDRAVWLLVGPDKGEGGR